MKVALAVNRVVSDPRVNLSNIVDMIRQARSSGADLILFPEAAITGLINNDDPEHDLALGQEIPGPITNLLADSARQMGIMLAIGLLETEGNRLYDTGLLFDEHGKIILKYRRISPGWHGPTADRDVYCHGTDIPVAKTPLGSFAFLICGDLFDNEIAQRFKRLRPDWLLFPFARCFDHGLWDQKRWDTQEKFAYTQRVRLLGTNALMVNYLADKEFDGGSFGGAMVVSHSGKVISELGLGKPGILLAEL